MKQFKRRHAAFLTKKEAKNPKLMISYLCEIMDIQESRTKFGRLSSAFWGSELSDGLSRIERSDYHLFITFIYKLLEAAYLIDTRTNKVKKKAG